MKLKKILPIHFDLKKEISPNKAGFFVLIFTVMVSSVYYLGGEVDLTGMLGKGKVTQPAEPTEEEIVAAEELFDEAEEMSPELAFGNSETTDNEVLGTIISTQTTASDDVYYNYKYWKDANTNLSAQHWLSDCSIGGDDSFKAETRRYLYVNHHKVLFSNSGSEGVNYYMLRPDYKLFDEVTTYPSKEEYFGDPGGTTFQFGEHKNQRDYTFREGNTKSEEASYTQYTAALNSYFLWKVKSSSGGGTLYKASCGAKTIADIRSFERVYRNPIRDKAISQYDKGFREECFSNSNNDSTNNEGINKYLDAGLNTDIRPCTSTYSPGYAWCVAFVSWVWNVTAPTIRSNPLMLHEVSTEELYKTMLEPGWIRLIYTHKVRGLASTCGTEAGYDSNNFTGGDILYRKPGDPNVGHTGMVRSYNATTNTLVTIEGNVGDRVSSKTYIGKAICDNWQYHSHWRPY